MKGENLEVLDDTYTITSNLMRRNLTRQIVLHAARCTSKCDFNIVKCRTVRFQMRETWMCIVFEKELNWDSCRYVKTSTKIYGKIFSRKQTEVNLRLTKGMREEVISLTKINNVLSGMGVECRNYGNVIIQDKRMRGVIKSCFEVIIHQNRIEHVQHAEVYLNIKETSFGWIRMEHNTVQQLVQHLLMVQV